MSGALAHAGLQKYGEAAKTTSYPSAINCSMTLSASACDTFSRQTVSTREPKVSSSALRPSSCQYDQPESCGERL
ncbi:MAG: hypothetical protein ACLR4A_16470 [Christensenellales bacterium]